jgi:hypothetical protein
MPETIAVVRDIFIIVLAFESLIVVALLIWLILELRGLTRVLREEVKPILDSAQETVNTVRGTTSFVSDNVVAPFVKVQGYVAGAKIMMDALFGRKPRRK